jgi:pimeloyl-ACP methyl ester carboxylesterase
MRRIDSTITIARPVPDVFGYFLDLDRHVPDTDPRVESVTKEPAGPTGPGTTFRFRQKAFGKLRETSTRFTALEPNRRIAFEGEVGPLRPKGVFTFANVDGGTTLNVRIEDTNPIAPLRPLAPLFARIGQKVWDDRLRRIAAVLEASRQPTQTHPLAIRRWYDHVLADGSVRSRTVAVPGRGRVHLLEKGAGTPVVLLHGSGVAAGFFLPLLNEVDGVRALAPDLPGSGLSDPIELPRHRYFETAAAWLDRLLDTLELDRIALLGHSAGGVWALRYALAHPERVERLVLIGPPSLPGTRCPLPYRLMATPGVGQLASRVPPSPQSVLRFATFMGEREALPEHPELIDLFLVAGRDPLAVSALAAEVHVVVSPFALLSRSGWRRNSRVRPAELRRLAMPTLVVWGDREPLGPVSVAQAVTDLIPQARLQVLPSGHAPWLGQSAQTAAAVADFVRGDRAEVAVAT